MRKLAAFIVKKLSSYVKKILPKSLVIEIPSTPLVGNKLEIIIFSCKKDELGPKNYFQKITRSLEISDAFKFRTQKISNVFNFGQNLVRNLKRPKFLVIYV